MNRLLNAMKLQSALSSENTQTRAGTVSSYDPDNYCCKVLIQPDGVETGWLPIGAAGVGNGWGIFIPPSIDDEVEVRYHEGNMDCGYVALRFFNNVDRPARAESGVIYLIHKTGSYIKLENNGKVKLHTEVGLDLGNMGSVLHTLVTDVFKDLFNNHTHPVPGVMAGAATIDSQKPTQQMDNSHLTAVVKGN